MNDISKPDLHSALRTTAALILAGGRGSRLMSMTDSLAKPAVPFGGKFRIVDFPLSNCLNSGIRRVAVLTQYEAHNLIRHVQRGWGFLRAELGEYIEIWPAQQQAGDESWYKGTADAVFQNMDAIRALKPGYVLILAGDHIYKQDYSKMLAEHIERGADATVACVDVPLEDAKGFGVVGVDRDDRIVEFVEKPANPPAIPGQPDRAFASMGIYIFSADFLFSQLDRDATDSGSSHDFGKDLIPYMVAHANIFAHRFSSSSIKPHAEAAPYWRDVGTVDAYWEANMDLISVTPDLDLYDEHWPIWTYQEQRPSAKFVFDDDDRRGLAVDSLVSAGCIISGGTVRRSLLFNNVRVNSYSVVEDTILLPGSDIGRNVRLRKCIVGQGCHVPEGLIVGEDPAADAQRFHVSKGGVTLITSDMLAKG